MTTRLSAAWAEREPRSGWTLIVIAAAAGSVIGGMALGSQQGRLVSAVMLPLAAAAAVVFAWLVFARFELFVLTILAMRATLDAFGGVGGGLGAAGAISVIFLCVGTIWLFAEPISRRVPVPTFVWPVAAFVGAGALSILFARNQIGAIEDVIRFATLVVIVLVLNQLLTTERALKHLLVAVYVSLGDPGAGRCVSGGDEDRVPRLGGVLSGARDVRSPEPVLDLPDDADHHGRGARVEGPATLGQAAAPRRDRRQRPVPVAHVHQERVDRDARGTPGGCVLSGQTTGADHGVRGRAGRAARSVRRRALLGPVDRDDAVGRRGELARVAVRVLAAGAGTVGEPDRRRGAPDRTGVDRRVERAAQRLHPRLRGDRSHRSVHVPLVPGLARAERAAIHPPHAFTARAQRGDRVRRMSRCVPAPEPGVERDQPAGDPLVLPGVRGGRRGRTSPGTAAAMSFDQMSSGLSPTSYQPVGR